MDYAYMCMYLRARSAVMDLTVETQLLHFKGIIVALAVQYQASLENKKEERRNILTVLS